MDIKLFKKNIKFFKKEKPEIYEFIKEKSKSFIDLKDTEEYTYLKSPAGEFLEDKKNLLNILSKNIDLTLIPIKISNKEELKRDWIHDTIIEAWDKILEKEFSISKVREKVISSKHLPLLFLNGIGTGNIINLIEKQNLKIDNLLIYEPDFYKFISSLYIVDWEKWYKNLNGNIFFIIGKDIDEVKKGLIIYFAEISPVFSLFFVSINLNNKDEKLNKILVEAIRLALKGWGYYDDEVEGLKHVYENLERKYPYIERPLQIEKNSNLFIIGSGPSLDERIDFIRENQNNAVIFSCGTAIHKLYKEGIVPDFQIELERPEFRVELFEDLPESYRKKFSIIAADVVPYKLLELYKSPILFPRTYSTGIYLLNPKFYVEGISPTVVNTATALSLLLGFENIYFFGVDMGYKDINKKHASDTIYGKKIPENQETKYIKAEDNEGGFIYTDETLFWAKENLEQIIKLSKKQNFYNLSLGAKINGTKFIKSPENLGFPTFNKNEYINKIQNNISSKYTNLFNIDKRNHYQTAKNLMKQVKELLHNIFEKEKIEDRFKLYYKIYEILEQLRVNNLVVYTLLSGTIKHILARVLFLLYSETIDNTLTNKAISTLDLIEQNLNDVKKYFEPKL